MRARALAAHDAGPVAAEVLTIVGEVLRPPDEPLDPATRAATGQPRGSTCRVKPGSECG